MEKESYLLELSRYLHLNPWRIKKSQDPFDYRWSSLRAYVGAAAVPKWLTVEEVLSGFGGIAKRRYREFIIEGMKGGINTPWEKVRGQAILGSDKFLDRITHKHLEGRRLKGG